MKRIEHPWLRLRNKKYISPIVSPSSEFPIGQISQITLNKPGPQVCQYCNPFPLRLRALVDFPILSHDCPMKNACSMKPLALCWLRKLDHHWDLRWTTLLGRGWQNVGFLWISLWWFSLLNSHSWGMPDTPIFYHGCGISPVSIILYSMRLGSNVIAYHG